MLWCFTYTSRSKLYNTVQILTGCHPPHELGWNNCFTPSPVTVGWETPSTISIDIYSAINSNYLGEKPTSQSLGQHLAIMLGWAWSIIIHMIISSWLFIPLYAHDIFHSFPMLPIIVGEIPRGICPIFSWPRPLMARIQMPMPTPRWRVISFGSALETHRDVSENSEHGGLTVLTMNFIGI